MKKVIILGAGGHAKVIADIINKSGDEVVGFLDDNLDIQNNIIYLNKKVLGTTNDIDKYNDYYFVIGIGNNKIRKKLAEKYNLKWYTAIHPNTVIGNNVTIGNGSVIMPGVVINTGTSIGNHWIINTSSSIDHDNVIGDYVHISPGSHLCGTVKVGEESWICAGVTVINNINIINNSIIGAGTVVLKNIGESGTYVGIPAKKIK